MNRSRGEMDGLSLSKCDLSPRSREFFAKQIDDSEVRPPHVGARISHENWLAVDERDPGARQQKQEHYG